MKDYAEGIKKQVAEVKFLIHDLRVQKFINDVIHFHVTLNTDLEIAGVEQIAEVHSLDLLELKKKAQELRKTYRIYSNAVKSFSSPETIFSSGMLHIENIQDICELIINPLWGRFDKVSSILPKDSRSFKAARRYKNSVRWICGVYYRIEHFFNECENGSSYEEFDLGADVETFTTNVIKGYVAEKSSSRVDIYYDRFDSAVVGGNRHRLRRMLFNLVMNSVDAMADQAVGVLRIGVARNEDTVELTVKDTGCGMPGEKKEQLLSDKPSLDGELHSLGFVFVRQTIKDFKGKLGIESTVGEGTVIRVEMPCIKDVVVPPRKPSKCKKFEINFEEEQTAPARALEAEEGKPGKKEYGRIILNDFKISCADSKGCIFAVSTDAAGAIDYFVHQPYEQHTDISHEDLNPMFYEATIRGRLEENARKEPELILKAPQNKQDYFEFKSIDETERSSEQFNRLVRDEYILISRRLMESGLGADTILHATDLRKFFPDFDTRFKKEPFPLVTLAEQKLTREA